MPRATALPASVAPRPSALLSRACAQALLAGGSFNGDVLLWDLRLDPARGEDPQVARSGALAAARHQEPVAALVSGLPASACRVPAGPAAARAPRRGWRRTGACRAAGPRSWPGQTLTAVPSSAASAAAHTQAWHYSAADAKRHGPASARAHLLLSLGRDGRLLVWAAAGGRLEDPLLGWVRWR
jgi:hypothetical protein